MEVVFGRTRNWVEPERQGFLLSQLSIALEKRLVIPTTKTVLDWNQVRSSYTYPAQSQTFLLSQNKGHGRASHHHRLVFSRHVPTSL